MFSIGLIPVQEWIAQARRSRDLRAGSAFLCHVMARVLTKLREDEDLRAKILLPAEVAEPPFATLGSSWEEAVGAAYGIPNRASGYCAGGEEIGRKFAEIGDGCLRAAWTELRRHLGSSEHASEDEIWFWKQLSPFRDAYLAAAPNLEDCPLTVVWVAAPAPYPREDLAGNLAAIDRLYDEVKSSRPVRPWPMALAGPAGKCNQCGSREAFGPTGTFEAWRDWHDRLAKQSRWLRRGGCTTDL